MTPPARTQAAIELLDQIVTAAREGGAAADTLVSRYFATRRYAGSKDRRAVRDLVYDAIRACGEAPASGRAAILRLAQGDPVLAATFDGSPHAPAAIAPREVVATGGVAPGWLIERLGASGIDGAVELDALLSRAPLDVRINTLSPEVPDVGGDPIAGLPAARRLPAGTSVSQFGGQAEVQDAGSQFVTLAARARPGQHIVDLCAGAGGKTLALAALMANQGRILACDTDRGRLQRLVPRAARAGVAIAEPRMLDPGKEADALADWQGRADTVLIDAPCSGTGTWRRNPEARWRLTPDRLAWLSALQARLLDIGAGLVRPGGALVYIVCSLLDEEGATPAAAFASQRPGWATESCDLPAGRAHGAGWRLTPGSDATDGFFVARFRAP